MQTYELAERKYHDIFPRPVSEWNKHHYRKIHSWLESDVCTAAEEISQRPRFQEYANWPIEVLAPGADTSERQLIDILQQSLVKCAKALHQLVNMKLVSRYLCEQNPPRRFTINTAVEISSVGTQRTGVEGNEIDFLAVSLSQVKQLANNTNLQLVNVFDYFEPVQQFSNAEDGAKVQHGNLIVSLNLELHVVGNFIVRCMLRRASVHYTLLSDIRKKALRAVASSGRTYPNKIDQLKELWEQLNHDLSNCREILSTGNDVRMRNSAIILTQVYAAFGIQPELNWLGMPDEVISNGVPALRQRMKSWQNVEMADRIATALHDMDSLYGEDEPPTDLIKEAIATGGLVLIKKTRTAHWEGIQFLTESGGQPWKLLLYLAIRAPRKSCVTEADLFKDIVSRSTMATTCNRLKIFLPVSLRKLVNPGNTIRTYRLHLDSSRIHIF